MDDKKKGHRGERRGIAGQQSEKWNSGLFRIFPPPEDFASLIEIN
jgi:hypothetical protein